MKQKYLLSMLIGGALLTACSVDDDLNLAPVAQEVNPSAPVFRLSFEDESDPMTRAEYKNNKVYFRVSDGDLLSLYHGLNEEYKKDDNNPTVFDFGSTVYDNAIYQAEGTDNAFELRTKSMVKAGAAIMVYPADTVNISPSGAPMVSIEQVQDEETLKKTPYMSAMLNIEKRSTEGDSTAHEAGYGRKYDIKMKRMATVFNLTVNLVPTETITAAVNTGKINEAEVKSVSLVNASDLFTKSIPVKVTEKKYEKENDEHSYWTGAVSLDDESKELKKMPSVTYNMAKKEKIARINMLPFAAGEGGVDPETDFENVKLVVNTTYGNVTIDGSKASIVNAPGIKNKTGHELEGRDNITVKEFMKYVVYTYTSVEERSKTGSGSFDEEYFGGAYNWTIDVNLADVDMTDMHLESGSELKDAITLYSIIKEGSDDESTFRLAGDDEGKFTMAPEEWAALEGVLADEDSKLNVVLCNGEDGGEDNINKCGYDQCTTIVLAGTGAHNIPDLLFETPAPVELTGKDATWTLVDGTTFAGTKGLDIVEGTVNLDDVTVEAAEDGLEDGIEIEVDATVNVTGTVTLKVNTDNNGEINVGKVGAPANLYVSGVKFENMYAEVDEDEEADDYETYCWTKCGRINNYGTFGVKNNGQIDNFGLIKMLDNDAATLITNNATETITLGSPASENNKIGCITLCKTNPTLSITTNRKGFIKYTIPATVTTLGSGTFGKVANYIVIDETSGVSNINTVFYNDDNKEKESEMKYLEITGEKKTVTLEMTNNFDALIIKKGAQLNINPGASAAINENGVIYLKGDVRHAGNRTDDDKWGTVDNAESFFGKNTGNLVFSGRVLPKE